MLEREGVPFDYREYREDPLDLEELQELFDQLGVRPKVALRLRDRANQEAGLTGDEEDEMILAAMVAHPTLLQRPIGVAGDRAMIGRPPERLLELTGKTSGADKEMS